MEMEGVEPPYHNNNKLRLDILCLRTELDSIKNAHSGYHYDNVNEDLKERMNLIWTLVPHILGRYGSEVREEGIKMLGHLAYFGCESVFTTIFESETEDQEKRELLEKVWKTLDELGLLQLRKDIFDSEYVVMENAVLVAVIREKNRPNEVNILRSIFEMLKKNDHVNPSVELEIWNNIFNHSELVVEFQKDWAKYCRQFRAGNWFPEESILNKKAVKKFELLFGKSSSTTIKMKVWELRTLAAHDIHDEMIIEKLVEYRSSIEEFFQGRDLIEADKRGDEIVSLIHRLFEHGEHEEGSIVLSNLEQESLKLAKSIYTFSMTYKCSQLLLIKVCQLRFHDEPDQIVLVLKDIQSYIVANKEEFFRSCWMTSVIFRYGFVETFCSLIRVKNGSLEDEQQILEEQKTILVLAYDYVMSNWNKMEDVLYCGCFARLVRKLVECQGQLGNFLEVSKVLEDISTYWLRDSTKFQYGQHNIKGLVESYLRIQTAIFDISSKPCCEIKTSLLEKSLTITKELTLLFIRVGSECYAVYQGMKHVIKCWLELGQPRNITLYLHHCENIYEEMFEEKEKLNKSLAQVILVFAYKVFKYVKQKEVMDDAEWKDLIEVIRLRLDKYEDNIKEFKLLCSAMSTFYKSTTVTMIKACEMFLADFQSLGNH